MMTPTDSLDLIPGHYPQSRAALCILKSERGDGGNGERVTDGRSPVLSRLLCDTAGDQPTLARRSVIALRGLIEAREPASQQASERVGSVMDAKGKRKTAEAAGTNTKMEHKPNSQITASGLFYHGRRRRNSLAPSVTADSRPTKSCNEYNIRVWVIHCSQEGVLRIRLIPGIAFTATSAADVLHLRRQAGGPATSMRCVVLVLRVKKLE